MRSGLDDLAGTAVAVLVFATLAVAWSWLGSYGGVVSLGHAVFFGIGAYAVATSNLRGGSPWYGALGGALAAVVVALLCALLCLRGRGYAFTAITLAGGLLAQPFAAARSWIGPGNSFRFPTHPGFFNLQFAQKWPYVLLAAAVFAVAIGLTYGLRALRLGVYLRALRTNPDAARSVGVSALPPRVAVLAASAFVTSVAGSLFAEFVQSVSPHAMLAFSLSCDIALIGVIAGPVSVWGPPAAALVYVLVTKAVPLHPDGVPGAVVLVVEAALVVAVARLLPQGLPGAFARRPRHPMVSRSG
jgi:branched-chain amino acid transport system permease protein